MSTRTTDRNRPAAAPAMLALLLGGFLLLVAASPLRAACGDGILDAGEACDDGNLVGNDGCSATCTLESNTCIDDQTSRTNVCTANDVRMALVGQIYLQDGCDFAGDTAQIQLQAEFVATSAERYDIGMFISLDGGTARSGVCHHNYLPPPLSATDYETGAFGIPNGSPVFYDGENGADTCGDLLQGLNFHYDLRQYPGFTPGSLQTLTVRCEDRDNDGQLDLGACVSWDNTKTAACNNVYDAKPNTKSKCNCQDLNVNVPFPGRILVDKVTVPAGDLTAFPFHLTGGPAGKTVDLTVDVADGSGAVPLGTHNGYFPAPGVYTLAELVPTGWDLTNIVCTESKLSNSPTTLSTGTAEIHLEAGETVTCTYTDTRRPKLKVVKHVVNDNGGTAKASDFTMTVTATSPSPASFSGEESPGTAVNLAAGAYSVSESSVTGYAATYGADCTGSIAQGEIKTCTITNDDVAPQLIVIKHVVNDNGGTAVAGDFTISVTATGASPASFAGKESPGTTVSLSAGSYSVAETKPAGYKVTYGTDCSGTIAVGETKTCTVTNDDEAPQLIVVKHVVNDDGGTAVAADFTMTVTGSSPSPASFAGVESPGTTVTIGAGSYEVAETGPAHYAASYGTDCKGTIAIGETKTCTVTNDDVAPKLIVVKHVVNDDGGTAVAGDFTMSVSGTNVSPASFAGKESPGTEVDLDAGAYEVTEGKVTGYAASYGADCKGSIAIGETKTCTVTNDDVAPRLTLVKVVKNDHGGTAAVGDFPLFVNGNPVTSGVASTLKANVPYTATETTKTGYQASAWTGDCAADGTITLKPGDEKTCTITNEDVAPKLTLVKVVKNDNGGTAAVGDFPLFANGTPMTSGVAKEMVANVLYAATETSKAGYQASSWTGDCAADGTITLAPGDEKTCTITNDDVAPKLTLIKTVINDNGGTKVVADFPLFVSGSPVSSGVASTLTANVLYTATETTQAGYAPSVWGGDCSPGGTITLQPGDEKTCTITNDDVAPKLKLVKVVKNDNGGTAAVADFPLFASGQPMTSGVAREMMANVLYVATETTKAGYQASSWTGDCAADGSITLAPGDEKTCTITNDDVAPKLTLIKTVVNNNGGTKVVADFPLFVSGSPVTSGVATTLLANQLYTATETGDPGYQASAWGGDCAADGTIKLQPGDDKTCSITNTDIPPTLTLVKYVVNDNGGKKEVKDFALFIDGQPVVSGQQNTLMAGVHAASETTLPGYLAGPWAGDCAAEGSVTLAPGEHKTCTITNDDVAPKLTLVKTVINDNGGNKTVADFPLSVNGIPMISEVAKELLANVPYVAKETTLAGYAPSAWGGDCGADGSIVLQPGDDKKCTITNDDAAPTLTLVKKVVNAHGGTLKVEDFPLFVDGIQVTSGVATTLTANAIYTASETSQPGYAASAWNGDCSPEGKVELMPGDHKTCTITNSDIAPKLTLIKYVTNDAGGKLQVSDFALFVDTTQVTSGVANTVKANQLYTASETPVAGYAASAWGGDCAANGTITLLPGDDKTCSITNDDIAPTLTVTKIVISDDPQDPGRFGLTIDSTVIAADVGNGGTTGPVAVSAGSHQVGEIAGTDTTLTDYVAVIGGDCAADGKITLGLADNKACTITNVAKGRLTVLKTVNQRIDPTQTITFTLTGPGGYGKTETTFGQTDGVMFESARLVPGDYKLCENPVPAGFTSYWQLDGVIVTPYNPNAGDTPPQDLGVRCYQFKVAAGQSLAFVIDNSHPGGEPRTIGYWKNWNKCTGGGQAAVARQNGGAAAGFFLVEDLLSQTIGLLVVDSCEKAVFILDKRDLKGAKKSSDAAYDLASQFLAARFNLAAGAATCLAIEKAVVDAQALLVKIGFTGLGDYLGTKPKPALAAYRAPATSLASTIDRYNNGLLCP